MSQDSMINVQIVTPAFNEATGLPNFIDAFLALRRELERVAHLRLLVVDDGSTDDTLAVLRGAVRDHRECLAYLSFAGNAGHQAALVAGLLNAGEWADAIVTMDSDLEHPFEAVPRMIDVWSRTGAIVVHAIRRPSSELPWRKRLLSALFYRLTGYLTGLPLRPGQADFKLWDASAVRSLSAYLPHVGSLRVFGAWMPGRQESVHYDQYVAHGRHSRFTMRKNLELTAISIIRFSHFPLKAISGLGILGLLFAAIYGGFVLVQTVLGHTVPGWSSMVLTVISMGCLQLLSVGILATYLSRLVFARDLPQYVVREACLPSTSSGSAARAPSDIHFEPPRDAPGLWP